MDTGKLLEVRLSAELASGLAESVPRICGLISSSYLLQNRL